MSNGSWWEAWLSAGTWADRRQNRALEEAGQRIRALDSSHSAAAFGMQKLHDLDRAQGLEIARLRATVNILVTMLSESGGLDPTELGYRMEAALAELEPELEPPGASAPTAFESLGLVHPAPPPEPAPLSGERVTCDGCGERVAIEQTTITENRGTLCDRCAATCAS